MEVLRRRAITLPMFPVNGTHDEQEAFVIKFTNSIIKMRAIQKSCEEAKMTIKKITELVSIPYSAVKCQAVNMNNTPCKFKAVCGKFCKKHQISKKDLDVL